MRIRAIGNECRRYMERASVYSAGQEADVDMKPMGIIGSFFSLAIAIALAVFGMATRSWIAFLFSAICLAVAGYLWFIQRDVDRKISGRGKV